MRSNLDNEVNVLEFDDCAKMGADDELAAMW